MRWEVAFGDRIDTLQKIAEREGKLPPALANMPEVVPHALPYFAAFKRLHSSRIITPDGSPGGIPVSEILAYAQMFNFESVLDRFDLLRYVQACDDAFIDEVRKRRPKPGAHSGKHTPRRRR